MKVRGQGGSRWVQNFVDEACRKYIFSSPRCSEMGRKEKGNIIKKESESKEKRD